jgi:hypothetical protein
MNKFYEQKMALQWIVALLLLALFVIIFSGWIASMQYSLFAVLLIFVITPIGQFLVSPFLKLTGVYKYLSPMLLVYAPNKKRYDLHNGTSFDYLFNYRKKDGGLNWQHQLLRYYLDGLLAIIEEIEEDRLPESIEVRGSSYFFSERTANKLGFETTRTGGSEKLNLLINYVDLVWMYSLAKGGIYFPRLANIKTATTTGKKLRAKKAELLRLKNYLVKRDRK